MKQSWKWLWLGLALGWIGFAGCSKPEQSSEGNPKPAAQKESPAQSDPHPEGKINLALKWPVGQRFVNQAEMVQQLEIYFPQTPAPMRQLTVSTQRYTLTVTKELEGGGREVVLEYGNISMSTLMGERQLFKYDSTSEEDRDGSNPVGGALGQVTGRQFTLNLNASGEVQDVPGLAEFGEAISKEAPHQARLVLAGMFEVEGFKQLVELGRILPKEPVEQGDSWPIRMEFSLGPLGGITLDATNTLSGWARRQDRSCAVLTATGTLGGAANRSRGPVGTQTAIQDGEAKGKTWVDYKEGVIVESEMEQKMTMLMTMSAPGQPASAPITNQLQQTMRMRLIEVGRAP